MTVSRFVSRLCLVLILAHSTLGTFPYPYPEFQPPLPLSTHLIYNVPIDGKAADFAGFSYFTKDLGGGGESEVVFITGPNSDAQMNKEVAAMKDQLDSITPASDSTKSTAATPENPEDSKEANTSEKNSDATTAAPLIPTEAKETSTTGSKDEKKDGVQDITDGQLFPEQTFALRAPYPILRLRGSTSFYPESVERFPGYEPFDYFKSKYDPFYGHFGSYQSLYNPFYSAIDDYYSRLSPLPYSSPIFTPTVSNFIPGESLPTTYPEFQGALEVKQSIGGEETVENSSQKPNTDGANAEKKPELSTSTEKQSEQSSVSSTPVPNAISSEQTSTNADSSAEITTAASEAA